MALEALEALALVLSSTLGLTSLALALSPSSVQDCQALKLTLVGQAVALEALEVMALVLSSTLGSISLALALLPAVRRTARRWRSRRSWRRRSCSAARWA